MRGIRAADGLRPVILRPGREAGSFETENDAAMVLAILQGRLIDAYL
jgi:hypothetical protein